MSRADLRDVLVRRGAPWVEDPSNADRHYARIRMRDRLMVLGEAGFSSHRIAALADALGPLSWRRPAWFFSAEIGDFLALGFGWLAGWLVS